MCYLNFAIPANQCEQPSIEDGTFNPVQNGYGAGDMVEFECNMGFYLNGVDKITCLPNGDWSDDFPTCERKLQYIDVLFTK